MANNNNEELLKLYQGMLQESKAELSDAFDLDREAFDYYVGAQLSDDVKQELLQKGVPPIEVNLCKKPVDVVVGYYSQNMGDIGVFPVELADNTHASILSQAIKWNMVQMGCRAEIIKAIKSAAISGKGWVKISVDYSDDLLNGNIKVEHKNQFKILFDPLAQREDAQDAQYVIERGYYPKRVLKQIYSKYADEIDEAQPKTADDDVLEGISLSKRRDENDYIIVDEVWYKDYVKKALVTVTEEDELGQTVATRLTITDYKPSDKKKIESIGGSVEAVQTVTVIKKLVVVNEDIVVEDSVMEDYNNIPYVPFFFDFTPEADSWSKRYQGIVRLIKPHNDEINKRKSQMMAVTLQQPLSGHYVEESSIVSLEDYETRSGPGKIIRYRGQKPEPIRGDFSALQALVSLDQMSRADIYDAGPNPDLLGSTSGSGPSAPGVTVQTRQRTALVSMQNAFDNFNNSLRLVGRIMIGLMLKNWSLEKFERVCDSEIPPDFMSIKDTAIYDIIVDEKANDKLYQFGVFSALMQLSQSGFPISPVLLLKYSGLDAKAQEEQMQYMQQMMQQAQQAQQAPQEPQVPGGGMQ